MLIGKCIKGDGFARAEIYLSKHAKRPVWLILDFNLKTMTDTHQRWSFNLNHSLMLTASHNLLTVMAELRAQDSA